MGDKREEIVVAERIEPRILVVRGQRVILDADLAALYGVTTKRLNEQVRRNRGRFPVDFVFPLEHRDLSDLRSQIATSSCHWGGRRHLPLAFTEHGAVMAASVLNTARAVEVSVFVVRAFVKMREVLAPSRELTHRLDELERMVGDHDETLRTLVGTLRELMVPPEKPMRRIGFQCGHGEGGISRKEVCGRRSRRN